MSPKKLKSFYPLIAQQLNVPVEVVEAMYDTFFEYLANNVRSLSSVELYVKNIGSFIARYKSTEKQIKRMEGAIRKNQQLKEMFPENSEHYDLQIANCSRDLELLLGIKKVIEENKINKDKIKELRHAYISRNLEEQGEDIRGDSE